MSDTGAEKRKLKVLAVYGWPEFWSMGEGRGAPSFFLSITSFPRHGHEMHVLMPGRTGAPGVEDYHGVTLHRFRSNVNFMPEPSGNRLLQHIRSFLTYAYWFTRAVPAGLALAARVRPDVVVGMGELGAPVAYRISRVRGVPNVTRLFGIGMLLDDFLNSRLKRMLRYREIIAVSTPADYVILCDDGSRGDKLADCLGVDANRLLYWPNGVDKKLYAVGAATRDVRAGLGVPEDNAVVLTVSRLHFEKHIERILKAVAGVLRKRADVSLVIVGSGPEEPNLRREAGRMGITESVVFAGSVGREELPDYYHSADVFVALSNRTNVSNSLHEAMIAGLPVIALNTGRTADVIRDGETGVLLEMEDLARADDVLFELLADEGRRHALAERARESADSRLPTLEERQAMEVSVAERAVRERGARGDATSD